VAQTAEHRRNWLLGALEPEEFDDLQPDLEIVPLPKGTVLYEAGDPIHYTYFPHNAVVGLINIMEDG
jgi:CRP-like cAMP-binding protein